MPLTIGFYTCIREMESYACRSATVGCVKFEWVTSLNPTNYYKGYMLTDLKI